MDRRDFIKKGALVGAVGATMPSSAFASENKKVRLKMVTSWPANYPILQTNVDFFARRVKEVSGGRIEIKVYPKDSLVPALGVFDATSGGQVDLYHSATYYWNGKNSAFSVIAGIPFGMTDTEWQAWIYFGGGLEIWREIAAKYNLYPLPGGNTGAQMGGWFKKEISSLKDLKGLKMRIPGIGSAVLSKLGVNTILIPGGEIFVSLEKNVIDATEWVGPALDINMGFSKIAKYYYTGWHEPASNTEIVFNLKKWDKLPDEYKAIIEVCANEMNSRMMYEFQSENAKALEKLAKENIEVRTLPEDVIEAAKVALKEIMSENSKKNSDFQKAYASYEEFMKKQKKWSEIGLVRYLDVR